MATIRPAGDEGRETGVSYRGKWPSSFPLWVQDITPVKDCGPSLRPLPPAGGASGVLDRRECIGLIQ